MRELLVLFYIITTSVYASQKESLAIGKWSCDPYTIDTVAEGFSLDVTHIVEYRRDGTSTDTHTFKIRGFEDTMWFKVAYSGPWKIENNVLIEGLDSTLIIDASIPELMHSEEMLEAVSFEEKEFISDILDLTKSKFTTKDRELDESGTCIKV